MEVKMDLEITKKIKINSTFNNKMETLLSKSSNHMISKVFSTKFSLLRYMWTIFGVISTLTCVFVIGKTISEFLEFKVSTLYRFYEERESEFPSITICNVNKFTTKEGADYLKKFYNVTSLDQLSKEKMNFQDTQSEIINHLSDEKKKKFGYNFKQMIISCEINHLPCKEDQFSWLYQRGYGNCFQFNNKQHIKQNRPGYNSGIKIELFIGLYPEFEKMVKSEGKSFKLFIINF
jgi:hypothetical protein